MPKDMDPRGGIPKNDRWDVIIHESGMIQINYNKPSCEQEEAEWLDRFIKAQVDARARAVREQQRADEARKAEQEQEEKNRKRTAEEAALDEPEKEDSSSETENEEEPKHKKRT